MSNNYEPTTSIDNAKSAIKSQAETLLGSPGSAVYVHSNDELRRAGTKLVKNNFDSAYKQLIQAIKNQITDWIEKLRNREQQWYKLIKVSDFNQFVNEIWPLILQSKVGDLESNIDEGLSNVLEIRDMNFNIRRDIKEPSGKYSNKSSACGDGTP